VKQRYTYGWHAAVLKYKTAIGLGLSFFAATATVVLFKSAFGLTSLVAIPAAVFAYVTASLLWSRYLNSLAPATSDMERNEG
jgi:hypothetical protein